MKLSSSFLLKCATSFHACSHLPSCLTITNLNCFILFSLRTPQSSSWGIVPYFPRGFVFSPSLSFSSLIVLHLQTINESSTKRVKYAMTQTIDISLWEPTSFDKNSIILRANATALWLPTMTIVFLTGKERPRKPLAIQFNTKNMMCMMEEYPTIMNMFMDIML